MRVQKPPAVRRGRLRKHRLWSLRVQRTHVDLFCAPSRLSRFSKSRYDPLGWNIRSPGNEILSLEPDLSQVGSPPSGAWKERRSGLAALAAVPGHVVTAMCLSSFSRSVSGVNGLTR